MSSEEDPPAAAGAAKQSNDDAVVENPLNSAQQLDKVEGDLWEGDKINQEEEDTNAVLAHFPCEQRLMGRVLATSKGNPSIFMRIVQASGLLVSVIVVSAHPRVYAEMSGQEEPGGLLILSGVCVGIAVLFLQSVFISAHRALAGGGALHKLGIGKVKLSESAETGFAQWRIVLSVLGLAGAIGFATLCFGILLPAADSNIKVLHAITTGIFSVSMWPAVMFWWASMRLASTLCRDHTIEVRHCQPRTHSVRMCAH